ncbi:MAG: hypothetical protein K0R57_5908 [Paenibacillaceae bacterium]|jgi:uncharacterized membrane protein|nr:hypothetical protein [Paenibacillaceae bacterium]
MTFVAQRLWFPEDAYIQLWDVKAVLFYFLLYSCAGWILEHGYHKLTTGSFAQEGFLHGPYKPMYGIAPVLILASAGPGTPWWWLAALITLVPTLVEFTSGLLLKHFCRKQWWDYSEQRFQLGGHICLRFSLYWAALSFIVVYVLQPLFEFLYALAGPLWAWCWEAAAAGLLLDLLATCFKYMKRQVPAAAE